ncbi:LysM peptidoglycan-binding domain-containing protein [Arthrobacter sunyaminii]|uniref:LysM peptidoglycan-binding domain-containing protein n=2 Tax=Arthrobacter TaxID=1663 RepID=A0A975S7P8_9MICC|nr:LysM peptidoglycan-binding domain-containing protein [Arthrobacter sunyaminii]QWQ37348.1 LysM peptidoglycan-binding domain-containing protein [Arthrobacter sunyaminii]
MTTQTVPTARTADSSHTAASIHTAASKTAASNTSPSQHLDSRPSNPSLPVKTNSLHLTRRGRLVFIGLPLMLAAAAALIVLGFFTAPAMASSGGPDVTRTVQVSVAAGESLWGLAQEFAPERDPRDVMEDIMELNNLTESRLIVGAQLYIPVER